MKRNQPDSNRSNHNVRWSPVNRPGVAEFVRAAEHFVQAKKYTAALEQLALAQKLVPTNKYIAAIIERVESLQRTNPDTIPAGTFSSPESPLDSGRYLSITVGSQFDEGIKPPETQTVASNTGTSDLIRELTDIAQELAKLGLPDPAFDALMRAYLIDPMSPDVISCEKSVLPLWNLARAQNSTVRSEAERITPVPTASAPAPQPVQHVDPPENEEARLEMLRQQKEMERSEKEREVWREASRVPRFLKFNPWEDSQRSPSADDEPSESPRRLFKKRHRKG